MNVALAAVAAFAVAFLVGSIPFGYLIGRAFFSTDLRTQGSGNIGAMNALRTLGKGGAIAVLLLDLVKGYLPALLALHFFSPTIAAIASAAAVLGHCFSPWLGWKGGKGVATAFGAIFALSPLAGLAAVAGWLVGALPTQYSSVGSMLGNLVAPVALWYFTGSLAETIFGAFAAVFIAYTHRENIQRLLAGRENRMGLFSRKVN